MGSPERAPDPLPRTLRALAALAGLCLLGGCATGRVTTYKPPVVPQAMVLVVGGAGGNTVAARTVTAEVRKAGLPYYVRSVDWTHGPGLGITDVVDVDYSEEEGRHLARQIADYRASFPGMPIYIVAHSAGAQVALEAAQWLGPNSLERIILVAPDVAADYDLRPALAAARQGVDAFTSELDAFYLGLASAAVGTADGEFGIAPAGRIGFNMPPPTGPERALADRYHEHPWDPGVAWAGHFGGHFGAFSPTYFREYVLPLLGQPVVVGGR